METKDQQVRRSLPLDSGRSSSDLKTAIVFALPYLLATASFVLYTAWSVIQHKSFQTTGYDLGIFEQAVRSYAEGNWPVSPLVGPDYRLLGDHFHPILATLAPLYQLWPTPETLLVAQAALLALSSVPVTRCAIGAVGTVVGASIGLGYVLSFGLLTAVTFDFHEICFAVPLISFAVERLIKQEWRAAALISLPLVAVKEDLPMTIAAIGLYLVFKGRQRLLGWSTTIFGVASTILLLTVVIPAINVDGQYAFQGKMSDFVLFAGFDEKIITVLVLLAPTLFLSLRSPITWLLLPTLAWRMLSSYPGYWETGFHYDAVLVPIAFLAAVDGMSRLKTRSHRVSTIVAGAVATSALIGGGWSLMHLLPKNTQPTWTHAEQVIAREVLSMIPEGASVAASNRLAPHLTSRCEVQLFPRNAFSVRPDWIVVARPFVPWPVPEAEQAERLRELRELDYDVVVSSETMVLLHSTRV